MLIEDNIKEFKEVCSAFHINKLDYCILRLPKSKTFLGEFEVDTLIKDTQIKNFHNILTAQNFQYSQDSKISHHHYRRGELHLDLITSLSYGKNKEYFASLGYGILGRRVFRDDLFFTNDMDELVTLLLHCLFSKRSFDKHNKRIFKLIDFIGEEQCVKEITKVLRG